MIKNYFKLFLFIGFLSVQSIYAQSTTVKGTVTDSDGQPLGGGPTF